VSEKIKKHIRPWEEWKRTDNKEMLDMLDNMPITEQGLFMSMFFVEDNGYTIIPESTLVEFQNTILKYLKENKKLKEEKATIKYSTWAISTIGDALNYNEHNLLNGSVLDRIAQESAILEEIEETGYTEEQFKKFHLDLLEMGVALLPTTEKAIERYGE
jgi:hypothetical protein